MFVASIHTKLLRCGSSETRWLKLSSSLWRSLSLFQFPPPSSLQMGFRMALVTMCLVSAPYRRTAPVKIRKR